MKILKFMKSLFYHLDFGQTSTFAASLAYYTALSLAPLLILSIAITSKLPGAHISALLVWKNKHYQATS